MGLQRYATMCYKELGSQRVIILTNHGGWAFICYSCIYVVYISYKEWCVINK